MSNTSILDAYASLRRELSLILASRLKNSKFGHKQMMILYRLMRSPTSMGELAAFCQSDPAATSRMVAGLEKVGFVKRSGDGKDSRRFIAKLTARGERHAAEANDIRNSIARMVEQTLDPEEQLQFMKLLNKVVSGLRETTREE
jgi:DNA-binding MarR family transcriptional regulator